MGSYGYVFASTVLTLWVILDPPGLLPVFLGLTRRMTPSPSVIPRMSAESSKSRSICSTC